MLREESVKKKKGDSYEREKVYDTNEESKALLSSRIMKSTMNLPSHAFKGLLIVAKYSIILPERG